METPCPGVLSHGFGRYNVGSGGQCGNSQIGREQLTEIEVGPQNGILAQTKRELETPLGWLVKLIMVDIIPARPR